MSSTVIEVRALTLWRPWPWAMLTGSKRVENRPRCWNIEGYLVALHSGQHFDHAGAFAIQRVHPMMPMRPAAHPCGRIEGAGIVREVLSSTEARARGLRWASDAGWCYVFERLVRFANPIAGVRGRQGLFKLDDDTRAMVVLRWNGGQPQD
jgi:hypothetical protein